MSLMSVLEPDRPSSDSSLSTYRTPFSVTTTLASVTTLACSPLPHTTSSKPTLGQLFFCLVFSTLYLLQIATLQFSAKPVLSSGTLAPMVDVFSQGGVLFRYHVKTQSGPPPKWRPPLPLLLPLSTLAPPIKASETRYSSISTYRISRSAPGISELPRNQRVALYRTSQE